MSSADLANPPLLKEFLEREGVSEPDRVTGLLPSSGYVLLLGLEKTGKSLLGAQLAACVAMGVPFLGMEVVQAATLFIEEEGSEPALKMRLLRQASALRMSPDAAPMHVVHRSQLRLDVDEQVALLKDGIEASGASVVIMGPLSRLAHVEDENKAAEFSRIARTLSEVAAEMSVLVILIHHRRKPDASKRRLGITEFFNASRGSNALTAAMDVGLGLDRDVQSDKGRLLVMGRDVKPQDIPIVFDAEMLVFSPARRESMTPEERQLKSLTEELRQRPLSVEDARVILGCAVNTARDRLQRLVNDGIAQQQVGARGKQVYHLREDRS